MQGMAPTPMLFQCLLKFLFPETPLKSSLKYPLKSHLMSLLNCPLICEVIDV